MRCSRTRSTIHLTNIRKQGHRVLRQRAAAVEHHRVRGRAAAIGGHEGCTRAAAALAASIHPLCRLDGTRRCDVKRLSSIPAVPQEWNQRMTDRRLRHRADILWILMPDHGVPDFKIGLPAQDSGCRDAERGRVLVGSTALRRSWPQPKRMRFSRRSCCHVFSPSCRSAYGSW